MSTGASTRMVSRKRVGCGKSDGMRSWARSSVARVFAAAAASARRRRRSALALHAAISSQIEPKRANNATVKVRDAWFELLDSYIKRLYAEKKIPWDSWEKVPDKGGDDKSHCS